MLSHTLCAVHSYFWWVFYFLQHPLGAVMGDRDEGCVCRGRASSFIISWSSDHCRLHMFCTVALIFVITKWNCLFSFFHFWLLACYNSQHLCFIILQTTATIIYFCSVGTSLVSDLKLFTTGISSTENIFQPPVTRFPCAGIAGQWSVWWTTSVVYSYRWHPESAIYHSCSVCCCLWL